ncbi:hypothetical protein BGZ73_008693, partial [Actinomortierella ambigua]
MRYGGTLRYESLVRTATNQELITVWIDGVDDDAHHFSVNFNTLAFKCCKMTTDSEDDIENEVRLLKRLQYRHIIQFYDVVRQHGKVLLVTDFAERG